MMKLCHDSQRSQGVSSIKSGVKTVVGKARGVSAYKTIPIQPFSSKKNITSYKTYSF